MSMLEVTLPSLGDDDDAVTGGEVSGLLAAEGAAVAEGGDLLELTTDKAAFVVPAPHSGVVRAWRVAEGDTIRVGQLLCILEVQA
jgi:pyruvate/2-oxoglutarate dehydrogenase complex dihydrolipoamide acyltransferase (E2) component